jgi:hypothetical protein
MLIAIGSALPALLIVRIRMDPASVPFGVLETFAGSKIFDGSEQILVECYHNRSGCTLIDAKMARQGSMRDAKA